MTTNKVQRITKEHESRYARWEQERLDYIRKHGLEAWDRKIEREIRELYPES